MLLDPGGLPITKTPWVDERARIRDAQGTTVTDHQIAAVDDGTRALDYEARVRPAEFRRLDRVVMWRVASYDHASAARCVVLGLLTAMKETREGY
jgi:hypothetical protein